MAEAETTATTQTETTTVDPQVTQTTQTEAQTQADTKAAWPENWRGLVSDDPKHSKTLERFASPKALYESYTALRQRMDAGEFKRSLPDKATPEQVAEWRKEQGIPDKPEDYDIKIEGASIPDDAKPYVGEFVKSAHELNLHPNQVKGVLGWHFKNMEAQKAALEAKDAEFRQKSEDALRTEWGGDYRRNVNLAKALLESASPNVKEQVLGARLANGTVLGDDPDTLRWLVSMARTINPVTTVVPGSGQNASQSIADEIAEIEKQMRENRSAYNKDEKKQARLRELYGARERMK